MMELPSMFVSSISLLLLHDGNNFVSCLVMNSFQLINTMAISVANVDTTRKTLWSLLGLLGVCIFTELATGHVVVQGGTIRFVRFVSFSFSLF